MKTKIVIDGYIIALGNGKVGIEISEEEYKNIQIAIENQPKISDNQYAKLKEDLTWEIFTEEEEIEAEEDTEDEDLSFLDILTGEIE